MNPRGLLIALILSLLMWALLFLLFDLGQRAFDVAETVEVHTVDTTSTTVPDWDAWLASLPSTTTTTTARARTAPTVRSASASRPTTAGTIPDIIRAGFARFGPAVAEQAVRVARCESRLDPNATNGQHASLFQISRTYHEARARRLGFPWSRMWEPEVNTAVAADIYAESGWRPWTCRYAA